MAKTMVLVATFAASIATASGAQAGSWTTRWTGPRGGVYDGSGNCSHGACESSGTFTGPFGGVWHHSGNLRQIAPGQWAGERTIVSPDGRSWQNSWTWRSQAN
jgi:hypothetical protein